MKYSEFIKEFSAKKYRPAYLFAGEEDYLAENAIVALVKRLMPPEERLMNYTLVYGGEADNLPDVLFTPPIFGSFRVTEVRQAQKLTKASLKAVVRYLTNPPRDGCLILWADPEKKSKGGYKRKKEPDFNSAVKNLIDAIECKKLTDNELTGWMNRYLKRQKKTIDSKAEGRLISINWPSIRELASELDRLVMMVGDTEQIRAVDIDEMGGASFAMERWALTNAVVSGNSSEAIRAVQNLYLQKLEPTQIIGDLFRMFYNLWVINYFQKKRMDKKISSVLHVPAFVMQTQSRYARRLNTEKIQNGLLRLLDADKNIKRGERMGGVELNMLITDLLKYTSGK